MKLSAGRPGARSDPRIVPRLRVCGVSLRPDASAATARRRPPCKLARRSSTPDSGREAFELFEQLLDVVKTELTQVLMTVRIQTEEQVSRAAQALEQQAGQVADVTCTHSNEEGSISKETRRPWRQPCPRSAAKPTALAAVARSRSDSPAGFRGRRRMTRLLALPIAFVVVACSAAPGSLPEERAENAARGEGDRAGAVRPGATDAETLVAVEAAVRQDVVRAWGVVEAAALSILAEDVTWSDGSLGCPRPGMMYTQALVPGWRLVVRDGGRELTYHASRRGQWLLCPLGRAAQPLPGPAVR